MTSVEASHPLFREIQVNVLSEKSQTNATDSLEDTFPHFAVVEGVAPAHLHRSHDDVLLENVRAQLPVQVLALVQRDLENAQHERQDGAWIGAKPDLRKIQNGEKNFLVTKVLPVLTPQM